MNKVAHLARAFPVDDAQVVDATFEAGRDVVRKQLAHIGRAEGVQVQHTVDRQLDWLVIRHRKMEGRPGEESAGNGGQPRLFPRAV